MHVYANEVTWIPRAEPTTRRSSPRCGNGMGASPGRVGRAAADLPRAAPRRHPARRTSGIVSMIWPRCPKAPTWVSAAGRRLRFTGVSIGNPHCVVFKSGAWRWSREDLLSGEWVSEGIMFSHGASTTWLDTRPPVPQKFYRIEMATE